MLNTVFESFNEAIRRFDYDYIYIDSIFLAIWLGFLIKHKKGNAIKFGIFTGFVTYLIDAIVWWNSPAGNNYPIGTMIREYWIGGVQVPQTLGIYFWPKFGADFMMTFSYSLFAFGWLWIMFENYVKRNFKEILLFTGMIFGFWLVTPFLSNLITLDDTLVISIRHMDTQMITWTVNFIVGYTLFFVIYVSGKFRKRDLKLFGYVFLLGCLGAFFMEFPLFISGIRPTGIAFLLYDTLLMFNQGAPYLYILYAEIFPYLAKKLKKNKYAKIELLTTN